jgi:hypothetical protein
MARRCHPNKMDLINLSVESLSFNLVSAETITDDAKWRNDQVRVRGYDFKVSAPNHTNIWHAA